MRKAFTGLALLVCSYASAQTDSLKVFNYARYRTTKTGMEVLGSWGIANLGVGAAGWAGSAGGDDKYFYQMTTIWGAANLGAAILGFTGNRNKTLNKAESLNAQKKIERTFLINGGLDVAYIGTGLFLKHRGDDNKGSNPSQLRGYGSSIIIQGAFLLLFDSTMYGDERFNGNKLRRFLQKNPITFNGKTMGLIYNM